MTAGRTRVKICGLRTHADLEIAIEAGADAVGVISNVPVDSPRAVPIETARELVTETPPFVTSVLVTMPTDADAALDLIETVSPDAVQLHGPLATDAVARIATSHPVISAIDVDETDEIEASADVVDAIILDSTDEHGAGGTGRTTDWERARAHVAALDVPVVLAGGLTPDNVASAIAHVEPYAVDVASGVEGDDGKDAAAVNRFIAQARTAGEAER